MDVPDKDLSNKFVVGPSSESFSAEVSLAIFHVLKGDRRS
jgi:hypothetical protein